MTHFGTVGVQRYRVHATCHTSARQGPHRSNTGMIYVCCLSLHTACSSALELLVRPNHSCNLSPYMCRRWGLKVSEMKMTRPDLIVASICGSRQDVCLNVYLPVYLSVCLSVFSLGARFFVNGWRFSGCSHTIEPLIWFSGSKEFTQGLLELDSIIIIRHYLEEILCECFSGHVIVFLPIHNVTTQKIPIKFIFEYWHLPIFANFV